jgi:hypothetical protein
MKHRILLQEILPLDELKKQGKVLLIRHSHENLREMYINNLIEEYQSFQDKPAFRDTKFIICFLGSERNGAVFYGIYELIEILEGGNVPEYSEGLELLHKNVKPNNDFYLHLKRIESFDKFKDRLVIDWIVPRGWYNTYGEVKDKEVIKILPDNYVKDFPGLMNIKLNFEELKKIIENPESHSEWFNSLSRLQAIYLILDKKAGYQYIGTTYGENGLWQRWETYAKGDHTGGNKELIKLKNENLEFYKYFQFSILEVLSKTADQKYCTEKETNWKEKLGSRAFGLNKN